ncbi:Uncharacterised protein [Mycobacteroides abscessus subsp. abscessus]|nr:Uncharacterised protein [Mycobacteroides abscessus subsp. abscessus]
MRTPEPGSADSAPTRAAAGFHSRRRWGKRVTRWRQTTQTRPRTSAAPRKRQKRNVCGASPMARATMKPVDQMRTKVTEARICMLEA